MSKVDVWRASERDLDEIVDVYMASFVSMVKGYQSSVSQDVFNRQALREMWNAFLASDESLVFLASDLATDGSTPVAVLALKPSSRPKTIELAKLFVLPEKQGLGIGRDVTQYAFQIALNLGYKKMDLWTWEISYQSRRMYEALGFVVTKDRGLSGYNGIPPESDVTLRYERDLSSC